ncbi:fasciclin domain-containing protein [Gramella jeungdoensis]|uniref:Fasciclin domain-containing protein n=1 Tax=Gramella jeungdoensis TaxID=708091 RepID=A0ABT0Z060_9FLAO|nr:fasciclin domain-containing protein [Gramella jeungdoensis]MCM8568650.1 fasciclin domain-containing protein [Gramella jeungdoensis]
MKKIILNSVLLLFSVVLFTACEKDDPSPTDPNSSDLAIYEVMDLYTGINDNGKKPAPKKGDDPIAVIAQQGGFDELVSALVYVDSELGTGLVGLFSSDDDQYTVFAPTDDAFEALYAALSTDEAVVDEITDLPAELVLDVLLYHVTDGRRAANSVVPPRNYKYITTLLGEEFQVNTDAEIMAIGSTAQIIAADVSASNGIIHVIDAVLLPIN